MNKNKLLFLTLFLFSITATIWSCKEEFGVEDQMRLQAELEKKAKEEGQEQDSIALSIQVYNASVSAHSGGGRTSSTQGVSNVVVKIAAAGQIFSQNTSAEGIANFWVQPGALSGTISGAGFATANFTITVTEAEDTENGESGEKETNASVMLPIFANTGSTTANVAGKVTFEGNLLNSTQETVPDGTVVTFKPDPTSLQNYYTLINSGATTSTVLADVDAYSFEATFLTSTTNGNYSIKLPAGANGLSYTFAFNDFVADQNIAINNYVNEVAGSVRDVVTISTSFGQGLTYQNPPSVAPVQFDIQAPPPAGTGAVVNLRLQPQSVLGNGNPAPTVMAKGSGYPIGSTTVPVTVNGGDFDATFPGAVQAVLTATTNSLGQVISITGTFGSGYRSRPTLTIGGGGSGAIVRLNWESVIVDESFPNGPSTVTAGGTGYLERYAPKVLVTGLNSVGDVTSIIVDTEVASGRVVGINPTTAKLSTIISSAIVAQERVQAFAGAYGLSNFGELQAVNVNIDGFGYADSPGPTAVVRGLRGGNGATVIANINNHRVASLSVTNPGSGYSLLTNANFPTTSQAFTPTSGALSLTVGQVEVLDAYYGTGRRSREVQ